MDPGTSGPRSTARRLRAIERGLLTTDAGWVRQVFGDVAPPLRRSWLITSVALDVLALGLLVLGVFLVLPLVFAGLVLGNVAVCMHHERRHHERRHRGAAVRGAPDVLRG